jgi:hypothetical protein
MPATTPHRAGPPRRAAYEEMTAVAQPSPLTDALLGRMEFRGSGRSAVRPRTGETVTRGRRHRNGDDEGPSAALPGPVLQFKLCTVC